MQRLFFRMANLCNYKPPFQIFYEQKITKWNLFLFQSPFMVLIAIGMGDNKVRKL